jgi:hypothetical protein
MRLLRAVLARRRLLRNPYRNEMAGALRLSERPASRDIEVLLREARKGIMTEAEAAQAFGGAIASLPAIRLARIPGDAMRAAREADRQHEKFAEVFGGVKR